MPRTPFKVVIPARYNSTRLPGKPLLNIAGKPMIAYTCQRAIEAESDEIVVATDDRRIFTQVSDLGINVVMTDVSHQSGTERINEVAKQLAWDEDDIVVNLQADEPLIPATYITDLASVLANQNQAGIATLAAKITETAEILNPNAVKVVLCRLGYALYFSRATIPCNQHSSSTTDGNIAHAMPYLRHIGMYAYRVKFLKLYCSWNASPLEAVESLEQLRILWHGEKILVKTVTQMPVAGVDTQADLERVEKIILASRTHSS